MRGEKVERKERGWKVGGGGEGEKGKGKRRER